MPAPGVNVTTALRTGPATAEAPPAAAAFYAAELGYGPTTPQEVRSVAQFDRLYPAQALGSGVNAEAHQAIARTFFEEGGQVLHVRRVVGPATLATANLTAGSDDAVATVAGIDAGGVNRGAFPADLGPGVILITDIDLAGVIALGTGPAVGLLTVLEADAAATRRIVYLAAGDTVLASEGPSPTLFTATRAALKTSLGGDEDRTEEFLGRFAVYGPSVVTPSGLDVNPVGYAAGTRAKVLANFGANRANAGAPTSALYLVDVAGDTSDAAAARLDAAGLNAIRVIAGDVRVYGARSLASDLEGWGFISAADTMNILAAEADARAEALTFRNIDAKGHLFAELRGILIGLAEEGRQSGSIFPRVTAAGVELDPGYSVDVSGSVNTPETIAAGQVNGVLSVRLSPTGALINIDVVKVAVGATI